MKNRPYTFPYKDELTEAIERIGKENFLKVWEACTPKLSEIEFKMPIIYGTSGEIPEGDWDELNKRL